METVENTNRFNENTENGVIEGAVIPSTDLMPKSERKANF